jgi:nicotinamide mononucleotide transporter
MVELFAAILTLWCVWLTTKRNILSWPVGIAAIVLYAFTFFGVKLYADFFLQGVFLIQSIYGWYNWSQNKNNINEVIINKVSTLNRAWSVIVILILYITISHILIHYTDASIPYADAYLTSVCIMANYLLSKRKIENWYLWIHADFLYIALFCYKGLYVSAVLYFILGVLAIKGLLDWKKQLNNKNK